VWSLKNHPDQERTSHALSDQSLADFNRAWLARSCAVRERRALAWAHTQGVEVETDVRPRARTDNRGIKSSKYSNGASTPARIVSCLPMNPAAGENGVRMRFGLRAARCTTKLKRAPRRADEQGATPGQIESEDCLYV
jgi:hypothetical protein